MFEHKKVLLKELDDMAMPVKVGSWCLPILLSTVCHHCLKLKEEKVSLHPHARDLAVGFWISCEGRKTAQFDFTVGGFYNRL